ncbi:putative C-terminal [Tripterygium wilfordii]|uniref:Putative C-terminal n=1 Tax=Tripterygium wilfordii TaxID=458696 RepID=A0A7J7BVR7_TRIWF|nr:proline-rich protein PRCC-like [Tripterygium wilfordii]KAF5725944.1 putative C-terminal [Tripterygium wilfordii]
MESLVANYASSDEEDEAKRPSSDSNSRASYLFSALPKPAQPRKASLYDDEEIPKSDKPKPSSLFFSLPEPKSQDSEQSVSNPSPSEPKPKRVVQFKPPMIPSWAKSANFEDDDEEDEDPKQSKRRQEPVQASSVKSFLSSIPAPRNSTTLGALPSALGSGRRAMVEMEAMDLTLRESGMDQSVGNQDGVVHQNEGNYVNHATTYDGSYVSSTDQYPGNGEASSHWGYESYGSDGNYADSGQYEINWVDRSVSMVPEAAGVSEIKVAVPGKRRKNDVPTEIVEVKQDELMKNRPRADQAKLTGIAFGPSYQPTSTKGKPTKLHKRKHQIGSLFYDMKQKEMELAERRAKGFLTKAETQAKYGW